MSKNEWARYIVLLIFCIYFSKTDIREKRIANKEVLAMAGIGLLLAFSSMNGAVLISCISGGAAGFLVSLFIACFSKGGIGMGDVKLLGAAGLYLGVAYLEIVVFWSLLFVILFGLLQMLRKKATRKTQYPYAPFFTAGVLGALCMQVMV